MTKYSQAPTGWWQDSKGRAQPPGSYADSSLRVPGNAAPETADRRLSTRLRHLMVAVRRRAG